MGKSLNNCSFRVTPAELQNKAVSLKQHSDVVKNKYGELVDLISRSTGYWEGSAADSFRKETSNYQSLIDDIFKRLKEHGDDLDEITSVYTNVEKTITEATQELPSDLIL